MAAASVALSAGLAWGGELSLGHGAIVGGAGSGRVDGWLLEGTAGQVVADSIGTLTAGGDRLQVGYPVQAATWNRPPVVGGDSVDRTKGSRVTRVLITTLMENDTDADGDALRWVGVGGATPAGAEVMVMEGFVVYVAPSGEAGHGSFEYEVEDGEGGHRVKGMVTVMETENLGVGVQPNAVSLKVVGGDRVFTGIGVPGRRYRVQYTTDAGVPYTWREFEPVAEVEAARSGALGVFRVVDRGPLEGLRLYRAVAAP